MIQTNGAIDIVDPLRFYEKNGGTSMLCFNLTPTKLIVFVPRLFDIIQEVNETVFATPWKKTQALMKFNDRLDKPGFLDALNNGNFCFPTLVVFNSGLVVNRAGFRPFGYTPKSVTVQLSVEIPLNPFWVGEKRVDRLRLLIVRLNQLGYKFDSVDHTVLRLFTATSIIVHFLAYDFDPYNGEISTFLHEEISEVLAKKMAVPQLPLSGGLQVMIDGLFPRNMTNQQEQNPTENLPHSPIENQSNNGSEDGRQVLQPLAIDDANSPNSSRSPQSNGVSVGGQISPDNLSLSSTHSPSEFENIQVD